MGTFAPVVPLAMLFHVLDHRLRGARSMPLDHRMRRRLAAVVGVAALVVEVDVSTSVIEHFPIGSMVVLGPKR